MSPSDPRGPFIPSIPMPVVLFPEHLQERVSKLPMPDADRDMLVMKVEQRREYLRGLGATIHAAGDAELVTDKATGNSVKKHLLLRRHLIETLATFWEEQMITRSDALRAAELAK